MKLLVATPIFDAEVPIQYLHSWFKTFPYLVRDNINFDLKTEARNDISQSRNRCAKTAIQGGFDKLLFIDADIAWEGLDVMNLLKSDKKIIGGSYPLKAFPIRLNFVPKNEEHLKPNFDVQKYVDERADENGILEVHRIPTGFLMIDVSVFKDIEPFVSSYHSVDPMLGEREDEKMYFPKNIDATGFYNMEDWGFCELAQKAGHRIYFHSKSIVDHVGKHTYSAKINLADSYQKLRVHDDVAAEPNTFDNPFKKWPVNLSCFCGSGKKFKKCHVEQVQTFVSRANYNILIADYEKSLAHVQGLHDRGNIYKLDHPLL